MLSLRLLRQEPYWWHTRSFSVAFSKFVFGLKGVGYNEGSLGPRRSHRIHRPLFRVFNNGWPSHSFVGYLFYTATMAPKNQVVLNNSSKATSLDMNGQSIRVHRLFSSQQIRKNYGFDLALSNAKAQSRIDLMMEKNTIL
jgi:hypothetical protein